MKTTKDLSNEEIIEKVKKILEIENDNQLAQSLGVERQQIAQFKKTKGNQICHKLLKAILATY